MCCPSLPEHLSARHHPRFPRREVGAVQAGTAKFLLLLGNRTDCTVNMGNEGFVCVRQSRFNFPLNAEALASLKSTPRSNFGRGVALKVTARGEVR